MRLVEVAPGEPTEVVASRSCLSLAVAVALPRVAGAVVAVPVEFHGEAVVGPAAVDPSPVRRPVCHRQGQPCVAEQAPEAALQGTEEDRLVAVDDGTQVRRSTTRATPLEHRLNLGGRRVVPDPGLMEGSGQGIEGEHRGQVDHRPRDRRHGHAAPRERVAAIESA